LRHRRTDSKAAPVAGLVSLDEAMAGAAADLGSHVSEKTEIAIAELTAPSSDVTDFLTNELSTYLHNSGKFIVLERGNAALAAVNAEHQMQMSGLVSDESAVGIGHYLGAKVIVTGSFIRFANFSQLRLRAIDVRTAQVLTLHTTRIQPDDAVLAGVTQPLKNDKPVAITEEALAYLNRGEDLYREGKYDEAIREYNRAIAINKKLAEGYLKRGFAYDDKGNYNKAIADYTSALRIKPDNYQALSNRGVTYYNKGDFNKAIADYTAALEIKPDDVYALRLRGDAYAKKGDYDRAIADWEAVLRINPDDIGARLNIMIAR